MPVDAISRFPPARNDARITGRLAAPKSAAVPVAAKTAALDGSRLVPLRATPPPTRAMPSGLAAPSAAAASRFVAPAARPTAGGIEAFDGRRFNWNAFLLQFVIDTQRDLHSWRRELSDSKARAGRATAAACELRISLTATVQELDRLQAAVDAASSGLCSPAEEPLDDSCAAREARRNQSPSEKRSEAEEAGARAQLRTAMGIRQAVKDSAGAQGPWQETVERAISGNTAQAAQRRRELAAFCAAARGEATALLRRLDDLARLTAL